MLYYVPEVIFIFYLFPLFYYLIVLTPAYLVYDFGIFFVSYLSGSGKSSLFLGELFSDTVAFAVFYIRKLKFIFTVDLSKTDSVHQENPFGKQNHFLLQSIRSTFSSFL